MGQMTPEHASSQALDSLVSQAIGGANQPLDQAETLPPQAYTSKAFFDLEMEKIFRKEWISVAHVSQIPNVGDYVTVDVGNEMLMAVRGVDKQVRVMSRVCLHRWAPLVTGTGNTRTFMCPFHAWGYALDGKLIGTPLMEKAKDFDPKACKLPEFKSEIVDGFVFVNLSGDAAPLTPRLQSMIEHQGNFHADELRLAATLTYDCAINWKIVVETFMECYHHLAAHPVTFERDFPARLSWGEETREAWTIVHSPARPNAGREVFFSGLPFLPGLTEEEQKDMRLYLVYPFHLVSTFADRIVWFSLQPKGPEQTLLQTHLLLHEETMQQEDFPVLLEEQLKNWHVVNMEDITVNEMQQKGARTASASVGRLSHLEIAIWQLSNFIRRRLAA